MHLSNNNYKVNDIFGQIHFFVFHYKYWKTRIFQYSKRAKKMSIKNKQ